jgi:hypothetical protein
LSPLISPDSITVSTLREEYALARSKALKNLAGGIPAV